MKQYCITNNVDIRSMFPQLNSGKVALREMRSQRRFVPCTSRQGLSPSTYLERGWRQRRKVLNFGRLALQIGTSKSAQPTQSDLCDKAALTQTAFVHLYSFSLQKRSCGKTRQSL